MEERDINRFDELSNLINNLTNTFNEFNNQINQNIREFFNNNINRTIYDNSVNIQNIRTKMQVMFNRLRNNVFPNANIQTSIQILPTENISNLQDSLIETYRAFSDIDRNIIEGIKRNFNERWGSLNNIANTVLNDLRRLNPRFNEINLIPVKRFIIEQLQNNQDLLQDRTQLGNFITRLTEGIQNTYGLNIEGLIGAYQQEFQNANIVEQMGRMSAEGKQAIANQITNNLRETINRAQNYVNNYIERRTIPFLHGVDIPGMEPSAEYMSVGNRTISQVMNENARRLNLMLEHARRIENMDLSITSTQEMTNLRKQVADKIKTDIERAFNNLTDNLPTQELRDSLQNRLNNLRRGFDNIFNLDNISEEDTRNFTNSINETFNRLRETINSSNNLSDTERKRLLNMVGEIQTNTLYGLNEYININRINQGQLTLGERLREFFTPLSQLFTLTGQMYAFTGIFGLTSPLFYQLSLLPTQIATISYYPTLNTALGLFGLQNFMNIFNQFPNLVPQLMMSLQEDIVSISSLMQSRGMGFKAVETALQIAKTEPIQFQEALAVIRTGAIYPELKPYIMKPEFQRKIFNVAQMLATIQPEQGIEGALFALRELFGGQTRSLQTRFNLDIDLISQYADISVSKLKSSPPHKIVEYLEKALIGMMGGTDFLIERAFTFKIQLGNIVDTLTQGIILPLNKESMKAMNFIETFFRLDISQGKVKISNITDFDKDTQILFPYLRKRFIELHGEEKGREKLAQFLYEAGSTPIGLLTMATNTINSALDELFSRLNIGDRVSAILVKHLQKLFDTTKQFNLGEIDNVEYVQRVGRIGGNLVKDIVKELESSGITQLISGISTTIGHTIFKPFMEEMVKGAIIGFIQAPLSIANIMSGGISNLFTSFTQNTFTSIKDSFVDIIKNVTGLISNYYLISASMQGSGLLALRGIGIAGIGSGIAGAIDNGINLQDILNLGIGGLLLVASSPSIRERIGNIINKLNINNIKDFINSIKEHIRIPSISGGLIAGVGLMATGLGLSGFIDNDNLNNILTLAGLGATIGSIFGLPGAIVGGALGAGIGYYFTNRNKDEDTNKDLDIDKNIIRYLERQKLQYVEKYITTAQQEYDSLIKLLPSSKAIGYAGITTDIRSEYINKRKEILNDIRKEAEKREENINTSLKGILNLIKDKDKENKFLEKYENRIRQIDTTTSDKEIEELADQIAKEFEIDKTIVKFELSTIRNAQKIFQGRTKIFNDKLFATLDTDKILKYHQLKAEGIPIPPELPVRGNKSMLEYLKELINYQYEYAEYKEKVEKMGMDFFGFLTDFRKIDEAYGLPSDLRKMIGTYTKKLIDSPFLPSLLEKNPAIAIGLMEMIDIYGEDYDIRKIISGHDSMIDFTRFNLNDFNQKYYDKIHNALREAFNEKILKLDSAKFFSYTNDIKLEDNNKNKTAGMHASIINNLNTVLEDYGKIIDVNETTGMYASIINNLNTVSSILQNNQSNMLSSIDNMQASSINISASSVIINGVNQATIS